MLDSLRLQVTGDRFQWNYSCKHNAKLNVMPIKEYISHSFKKSKPNKYERIPNNIISEEEINKFTITIILLFV